jgi:signal transduction histidine kinase
VRRASVLRTTTFRLAAIYVVGFAASVATLGVVIYLVTAATLSRQLDGRIESEMQGLQAAYRSGGTAQLVDGVTRHEHAHPNGALDFAVLQNGKRIAGHLKGWPATAGWSVLPYQESNGDAGTRRLLRAVVDNEIGIVVGADPEDVDEVKAAILDGFLSAFGTVLVLGIGGGIALSVVLLRRVEAIRRTADAIIAGDLSTRIPLRGTGDDFDRLSHTLNRMLDRIAELMESLREVSANIAHDLKTPLARLRQRLERAQSESEPARVASLQAAVMQVDEILGTFSALLRIAQIEAGTRRAGFADVDLSELFAMVAEAFVPAAEDAGKTLTAAIAPGVHITGDRELLTQMLANLIDNAIRHTERDTAISVGLYAGKSGIAGLVADNGCGVPETERERIFHRFHRQPDSFAVPGSGLGLSLVKAVADLHGIAIVLADARPGLRIGLQFPACAEPVRVTAQHWQNV